MEAEHIHDPDVEKGRAEQLGALRHAGTDEETAVGASADGEPATRGVLAIDQPLGAGDEVIEHVLFALARTDEMPLLAVFAATAQVGDNQHSPELHPDQAP